MPDWPAQVSRDSPYRNSNVTYSEDSNSGLNACMGAASLPSGTAPDPTALFFTHNKHTDSARTLLMVVYPK